jgi:lambda family phage portal protein
VNLKEVKTRIEQSTRMTLVDRVINYVSPSAAFQRMRSRAAMALLSSYTGASKTRRSLSSWHTEGSDADTDILSDLPTLRERSRDLCRNNPLAGGAIKTKITNVIGTGLRFQSQIKRDVLGLDEEAASKLERLIEREWRLFWDSKDVDLARTLTGHAITRMVYNQEKENGDVFVLLPRRTRKGSVYDLRLQIVEADRVCNPDNKMDTDTLAGGIERDQDGAPVRYHILNHHPGSLALGKSLTWETRDAFNPKTGLRNVLHIYNPTRPGQSRGVPDLAAVIEPLKQLGRYTEAEIMAAVVSGLFTVFVESDMGAGGGPLGQTFQYADDAGNKTSGSDNDAKLGNGLIIDLAPGEKVSTANPGRPNQAFDNFVQAILRQIGVGLELPFEILIKHFTKSYSAARAALLELWKYVLSERQLVADNFLRPVQEVWMWEAVAKGRIPAPGFFDDPAIRRAYLAGSWVGPTKGQIDELKEVKAARERIDGRLSTLARETAELTGADWDDNHAQQVKEKNAQIRDGLLTTPTADDFEDVLPDGDEA